MVELCIIIIYVRAALPLCKHSLHLSSYSFVCPCHDDPAESFLPFPFPRMISGCGIRIRQPCLVTRPDNLIDRRKLLSFSPSRNRQPRRLSDFSFESPSSQARPSCPHPPNGPSSEWPRLSYRYEPSSATLTPHRKGHNGGPHLQGHFLLVIWATFFTPLMICCLWMPLKMVKEEHRLNAMAREA